MINKYSLFQESTKQIEELISLNSGAELTEYLNKYKFKDFQSKINFNSLIVLNSGNYGIIFSHANESNVYKLTFDKNSYLLARKLIGKKFKHLIDIIDVDVISNNIQNLFLIKMEECLSAPQQIELIFLEINHDIIDYIKSDNPDVKYDLDHIKFLIIELREKDILTEEDFKFVKDFKFEEQVKEIKEELMKSGLIRNSLDIHAFNIMLKKGTKDICLIDFITPKKLKNL